nr:putative ribonuclease H-like domain-containing protein [Tanacetum cinerariifolium]
MTDYSLWEVILNGDSLAPTKVIEGVVQPVTPTTTEQMLARKNKLKAHGTLLMALPDKHQLKFNIHKDAKTLMKAIKKSLPTKWRTHTLIWRNKIDLEEQSLDDLFNSHKIYKAKLDNDELKQIVADDLEEMDLKWQMAMLTVRASSMFNCDEMFCSETDESLPASPKYDSKTIHTAFNVELSPTKPDKELFHRTSAPIIEDWVSNSKDDSEAELTQNAPSFIQPNEQVNTPRPSNNHIKNSIPAVNPKTNIPQPQANGNSRNRKACFIYKSLTYLIKELLTKSKLVPLTASRQVTTVVPQPHVNRPRPAKIIVTKSPSPPRRNINHRPSPKPSNFSLKVTTVKVPHHALKDKGVIDSGCLRYMIGNMSYLSEFEEINGGYVAFGHNPKGGKIYGKGKIKTGKLDFDDVYFLKEVKFNLFSVSQMCDKKNSVLFTDVECIVLSPEFKLLDENQVLLRVPRENNMYNVDLKNIVPSRDLTCLFSKATIDESNLWHRRLGHINFKIMNKLVKGNLVRGLPSKVFENNHTCVACKKGKQHKASCKTKHVSSVSQPLQRLHMDLFGPTFVKSLNKKSYCLVVTDDYSRFTWVFFLATKNETSPILKTFITGIENQLSLNMKIIRSDNGTEFKNYDLIQFCRMKGIKRKFSVPKTPQQNGIVERKNKTLIEAARTMLADSLLPIPF